MLGKSRMIQTWQFDGWIIKSFCTFGPITHVWFVAMGAAATARKGSEGLPKSGHIVDSPNASATQLSCAPQAHASSELAQREVVIGTQVSTLRNNRTRDGEHQHDKLHGVAWTAECKTLVGTLKKLQFILGQLQAKEQRMVDMNSVQAQIVEDRTLAMQLLAQDAAAERARLEQKLKEDPQGRHPIDLPELAAALLKSLAPLLATAVGREPLFALPADAQGMPRNALALFSEQVASLALVADPVADGENPGSSVVQFRAGSTVRISGLLNSPELNGCVGVAELFDEAAGRWRVRLQNGVVKSVRPMNLFSA